jgi:PAS domain S-box-containing protein
MPASVLVWHTDASGPRTGEQPLWSTFTGQAADAYADFGWLDAVHPEDRERVRSQWRDAVAGADQTTMQYRLRRADGEYRLVEAHGVPVVDGAQVRQWVGICVDTTERTLERRQLQDSAERLDLLDRLSQATRSMTEATEIMAATARILGEHLDVVRCAYADVETDNDRFTIRSDWSREGVASSAGVYSLDLFGHQATENLRNGRRLVVRDVDRELGDDGGGRMFNAIGIKAIITAPLVKQGRLVAMMAVHESQPRDWTEREISIVGEVVDRCWAHIERVRDAALVREQDRRKDDFLATLAHELRNPLAPMRYALAVMGLSSEPAKTASSRAILERQVGHMARLVDDLLDQSRINRGQIELRKSRVGLADLMRQAVEAALPSMEAARHGFEITYPEGELLLDVDPARIVQAIGNVLNNAAKYTPDGGCIRLAGWRAGSSAVLEVVDDGVGIPFELQGQVFGMFAQLPHTRHRAKGGLGIGLSLAKRLLEMHGGSIAVHSDGLDMGTTFRMELPALDAAEAHAAAVDRPEISATADGHRIVVVEDNADGRETLLDLLDVCGHTASGAPDGVTGLAEIRRVRPDVVLLDLGLPGMDGCDVARAVKADPALADVTLVALTGWGADRDRHRTREAGFDHHLTKPVDPGDLESFLRRLKSRRA